MSILSPEQIGQLALLRAIVDPDAKQQLTDSVQGILDAAAEADKKLAALQQQEATNRAILSQADHKLSAAAAMKADAEACMRVFEERQASLAEVSDAFAREKAEFEAVRQSVQAEHDARHESLTNREESVQAIGKSLADLMAKNTDRAAELDEREAKLSAAVEKLKAAMGDLP